MTPEHRPAEPPPRSRMRLVMLPLTIFIALAGLFALSLKSGDPSRLPSALIGKPAPPLVLPALEGLADGRGPVPGIDMATLADGKPTVVNFWASWCAPCVAEHPLLIELGQKTGVRLVGVNYKDQTAAARRFLGRYGNPFAAVGVDATGRQAIEWGVYGMPETFVLDGKGHIVHKHVGPITPDSLVKSMLPAVDAAKRSG
jgi:cytochrome c biogenesis protein CcmG/thiol:disulfide interchange protein DsbE